MKIYKLGIYLLLFAWLLGLAPLTAGSSSSTSRLSPAVSSQQIALAAPLLGPNLTIPSAIPAPPNDTVNIPIQFNSNGNPIASLGFSVNYDNTWLDFDPTLPFSITFSLPPSLTGDCEYDLSDTDGEIDCVILDPVIPISTIPDGIVASIRLRTLNAPEGTLAPVSFSNDPEATFGDPDGAFISGSTTGGSVLFVYIPDPPSGLTTSLNICSIHLQWTDNSDNETGFKIERRSGALPYSEIAVVGANVTQYTDYGLQPGTTYTYRVRAYNEGGNSAYSNQSSETTESVCYYPNYIPMVIQKYAVVYSISGSVSTPGGSPVSDALVCAAGECTNSNASGEYTIIELPEGAHDVTASKGGEDCTPEFTNPVTLPPSATGIDFTCAVGGDDTISGRVLDNFGTPISGATVADQFKGYSTVTNEEGYYMLTGLPADSYTLAAIKSGYQCTPLFANPVTIPPGATDKDFSCVETTCYNLINNGGFEERHSWEIPITEYSAGYEVGMAHSGVSSMRTGITYWPDNRYSYSSARQLIKIPSDATQAILRYYVYRKTTEVALGEVAAAEVLPQMPPLGLPVELAPLSGDIQMTLIIDPNENILSYLMWGLGNKQTWQYRENNLMEFRGSWIKIYFGTYNDGWGGITSMHVDDVELEVCQ